MTNQRILVTGAGGFIGHHMVRRLKRAGYWVRGVDFKGPLYEETAADEFEQLDLRRLDHCFEATRAIDQVYNFAADAGGMRYMSLNFSKIARNNSLINLHMLEASRLNGVHRYFYPSSVCVYAQSKLYTGDVIPLREEDVFPADPEPGYGWEKLYAEQLCAYYRRDYLFETRIARLTNVYGPLSRYEGGKERAPAGICRMVAMLSDGDEIEIWGDGQQAHSFLYIDDCVEAVVRLMASDYPHPVNLGGDRTVTIDELVDMVSMVAGKRLIKRHDPSRARGVRNRSSDNTRLKKVLKWKPSLSLEQGLSITYRWIEEQLRKAGTIPGTSVRDVAAD